jgi:hypothetical protein
VTAMTELAPPVLHTVLAQAMSAKRLFNVTITNIPGSPRRLYAFGAPMVDLVPIVPLAAEHTIAIAAVSYAGGLTFGLGLPVVMDQERTLSRSKSTFRVVLAGNSPLPRAGAPRRPLLPGGSWPSERSGAGPADSIPCDDAPPRRSESLNGPRTAADDDQRSGHHHLATAGRRLLACVSVPLLPEGQTRAIGPRPLKNLRLVEVPCNPGVGAALRGARRSCRHPPCPKRSLDTETSPSTPATACQTCPDSLRNNGCDRLAAADLCNVWLTRGVPGRSCYMVGRCYIR